MISQLKCYKQLKWFVIFKTIIFSGAKFYTKINLQHKVYLQMSSQILDWYKEVNI